MDKQLTLGSLFDGSGGFPLGGMLAGIRPVWASEIEPFPIRVTTKRLPFMKHYGDVSTLNGTDLEPVDIITFGSPCQDMSLAGRRAGLDGSRSNLFYEAVRIAKEMRKATNGRYPIWLCWENVPGAFSSNGGADFKAVLDEIRRIKDPEADTPRPAKWPNAGCILADDHSIAWRVLDAQYWGVPQRRKRIFLVADLAGQRAGKVLFESEGVSGYTPQGFRSLQGTAGAAEESADASGNIAVAHGIDRAAFNQGQNAQFNITMDKELEPPMLAKGPGGVAHPVYSTSKASYHMKAEENVVSTLVATDYKDPPIVTDTPSYGFYPQMKAECVTFTKEKSGCLVNGTNPGFQNGVVDGEYIVRRLMPVECARLQGFPDWWCRGLETEEPNEEDTEFWRRVFETFRNAAGSASAPKSDEQIRKWLKNPHSDSAEYKLWGNGVALPCVHFVLSGIAWADCIGC